MTHAGTGRIIRFPGGALTEKYTFESVVDYSQNRTDRPNVRNYYPPPRRRVFWVRVLFYVVLAGVTAYLDWLAIRGIDGLFGLVWGH